MSSHIVSKVHALFMHVNVSGQELVFKIFPLFPLFFFFVPTTSLSLSKMEKTQFSQPAEHHVILEVELGGFHLTTADLTLKL